MADGDNKVTQEDLDKEAKSGGSTTTAPPVALTENVPYPGRMVNDSPRNLSYHPDALSQSTYFSPSRGMGTGRTYVGPHLVDENGDLSSQIGQYSDEEIGRTFYTLAAKNNGQDLEYLKQFLYEYTPYYGKNKPSPGTTRTSADMSAIADFFDEAVLNGKTWRARMLDVMRGAKMSPQQTGSGRAISVTSPEDISRSYLDASFKILGRAATQQEMQSAISWIQQQERARAAGGGVDPMTLATASQTRAGMASPNEAVAQKVGTAINELMSMLGGG